MARSELSSPFLRPSWLRYGSDERAPDAELILLGVQRASN